MSQASDPNPTRRSIAAAVTLAQKRLGAERHVRVQGLRGSARAAYLAALYRAQPRPMTSKERQKLLEDVFRASGWLP